MAICNLYTQKYISQTVSTTTVTIGHKSEIAHCSFADDFFARGLHTHTAVARFPLRQLGFLVY